MFDKSFGEKMVNRFFRRVDDVVWDLMTGKVGVRTSSGEVATLDGEGDEAQIVVNPFAEFGIPLPAFAQNTQVADIHCGDLIYSDKRVMGWVVKVPEEGKVTFKLLKQDGTRGEWRPPKVQSLGLDLSGAMVLRSLVNTLPDGNLGGLQGSLMPLMMMSGGDFGDMEDMLPMLLMSQCGMMGGTADGGNNMLQTMMMMKMMGGSKNGSGKFFD
jgi:hypothetical protein